MTRTLVRSLLVVVLLLLVTVPAFAQSDPVFPQPATVTRNANLRAGPGTSYAVAGSARAGDAVTLVGGNAAGDWYELASGEWIAAFLVEMDAPAAETATPAARASAAELQRYANNAIPYTQLIGEGLDAMSDLLLAPKPEDVDWLVALYTALGVIQGGHELLMEVTPPPSLVPIHEQLLAGTQDCSDATHAIMDGIETVDVAHLERAFTLLESCTEKTEASLAMMEAYKTDIAATPTATATPSPSPSATRRATATPTPTATQTTRTTTLGPTALRNANLRDGPGTSYAVVGGLRAGQAIEPMGRNSAGDWIQLNDGAWVAASLLSGVPADLPVTAVAAQLPGGNPTPRPTVEPEAAAPAPTPGWQTEQNGIIFTSDCPCDQGDVLNCGDFGIAMSGQACYLRCMELTGRDVHRLDRDKDGSACEWEW